MKKQNCIYLLILIIFSPLITNAEIGIECLGGSSIEIGAIIKGETRLSDYLSGRTIIKNAGNEPIDLQINIISNTAGWTPVNSSPGPEQFRLFGVFHQWDQPVAVNNFGLEDVITSTKKTASSNIFAIDSEDKKFKGYNVLPGTELSLVYRIDAPAFTKNTNVPTRIFILITAVPYTPPEPEKVTKPKEVLITPNGDGINDTIRFPGLRDREGNMKANVRIRILDMTGSIIKEITDKDIWDGTDDLNNIVRSGVYMYQYEVDGKFICGLVVVAK